MEHDPKWQCSLDIRITRGNPPPLSPPRMTMLFSPKSEFGSFTILTMAGLDRCPINLLDIKLAMTYFSLLEI